MNNLLLYDFLLAQGGAEKLSLELVEHFECLDLLVGFVNEQNFRGTVSKDERINSLKCEYYNPVLQTLFISKAFASAKIDFFKYDKVIYSGSYAPLALHKDSKNENIMYCHTPPRFVYDLKQYYFDSLPVFARPFFHLLINYFQPKYEEAFDRMDLILANSMNVQNRIKKFLNRDSTVIYPPCDTTKYKWLDSGNYYLSTARLEPYKRVDLVVKAFMETPDKQLIVASGGSQLQKLKKLASGHSNITFTGWCSDEQLYSLIGNAIATIYIPMEEDFGMSPVESMSAGKPVVAVNEGGIKETIIDWETGILIEGFPTIDKICDAISIMSKDFAISLRERCEQRAVLFSKERFLRRMAQVLE